MQYMGSKASLAKYIIPILSKNRRGGGCNTTWSPLSGALISLIE